MIDPKWNRAGNIVDFFTTLLTNSPSVTMTSQHASAWAYAVGEEWCVDGLEKHLPVHLLPKIVSVGTVLGPTQTRYLPLFPGVKPGVKVLAGMGDMQCSLLPVLVRI